MHNSKKSKYKTSYFTGKVESATHDKKQFDIGDRVKKSHTNLCGIIKTITKSNFGKGRCFAIIDWEDGTKSKEPLGRLKLINE